MTTARPTCQRCGAGARVHISSPGPASTSTLSHYCLACADELDRLASVRPPSRSRIADALVLVLVGTMVTGVSLFADSLRLGGSAGFGHNQWSGVALGGVLLLCGAATRAPLLLVAGAIVAGVSAAADYLRADGASFGWTQRSGVIVGLTLLVVGLTLLGFRFKRRAARSDERFGSTVGQVGLEGQPPEHSHQ